MWELMRSSPFSGSTKQRYESWRLVLIIDHRTSSAAQSWLHTRFVVSNYYINYKAALGETEVLAFRHLAELTTDTWKLASVIESQAKAVYYR